METSKNNQEHNINNSADKQHQQSRMTNHVAMDTAKTIVVGQNKENIKKARKESVKISNTESKQKLKKEIADQQQSNIQADKQQHKYSEKGKKSREETTLLRERKLEDWTKFSGNENTKTSVENETPIPVKNYRSPRSSASLPTERHERNSNNYEKRNRRKSLSTYSKTSTASRNFG